MNAKFTPGPWATIETNEPMMPGQSTPLYVSGGIKLATITWNPALYRSDVMDANAHLIAAAPDMYKALKLLQSALTEYRLRDTKKRYSLCVADAAASQALAKAEGIT